MKQIVITGSLLLSILFSGCKNARAESATVHTTNVNEVEVAGVAPSAAIAVSDSKANTKIQVAILLDTSSSMDGLIEQAKSRLWNIVNTLTTLKFKGKAPEIEIALYEYGNNGIQNNEYIRQVVSLSTDLDLISQKLFSLTTNGGSEYCGAVINKAAENLEWSRNDADIHLIYIAGNEPFTQGNISYKEAISTALNKNIFVNTIHCGNPEEGVNGMWRDGAIKGKGKYFNINHNQQVRYIETPYDDRISSCNVRLNDTYISYGHVGQEMKMNQVTQDRNAGSISKANATERTVSKSKSVYKNSSWDMVDRFKEDKKALDNINKSDLPEELQDKSKDEIKALLAQKEAERTSIQKEIETLAKQRQAYIDEEMKNDGKDSDDFGKAINQSVMDIALLKGYTME